MLGGYLNFECKVNVKGYDLFKNLIDKLCLYNCDILNSSLLDYTYRHEGLSHKSWIDHLFVSDNLKASASKFCIIDNGANCSDHLPISCTFNTVLLPLNTNTQFNKNVLRDRWDKADLGLYYQLTGDLLQRVSVPSILLSCSVISDANYFDYKLLINSYYSDIVHAIKTAGSLAVPKIPVNCLKQFWSEDLSRLKEISVDMHRLWRSIGSPMSGSINMARLKAKLNYKIAIKLAIDHPLLTNSKVINESLLNKTCTEFWKIWINKFNKHVISSSIESFDKSLDIANVFAENFSKTFTNSADDTKASQEFDMISPEIFDDIDSSVINIEDIELCLSKLKLNKASGHDGLSAEHILNAHPALITHLKKIYLGACLNFLLCLMNLE